MKALITLSLMFLLIGCSEAEFAQKSGVTSSGDVDIFGPPPAIGEIVSCNSDLNLDPEVAADVACTGGIEICKIPYDTSQMVEQLCISIDKVREEVCTKCPDDGGGGGGGCKDSDGHHYRSSSYSSFSYFWRDRDGDHHDDDHEEDKEDRPECVPEDSLTHQYRLGNCSQLF